MRYTYRIETIGTAGLKLTGIPEVTQVYYVIDTLGRRIATCFRESDADDIVTKLNYAPSDSEDDRGTSRFDD